MKITGTTLNVVTASGCWISGGTVKATNTEDCIVIGASSTVKNALRTNFYFGATSVTYSANTVNVYGKKDDPVVARLTASTNCTAVNCKLSDGRNPCLFYSWAINCTAVNCTGLGTGTGSVFYGPIRLENCTAVNCKHISSVFEIDLNSRITNCTAVNCTGTGTFNSYGNNSSGTFMNCTAVNCKSTGRSIFDTYGSYGSIAFMNCTAVNCTGPGIFDTTSSITNCTAVNCMSTSTQTAYIFEYLLGGNRSIKNCLSWNNSGT